MSKTSKRKRETPGPVDVANVSNVDYSKFIHEVEALPTVRRKRREEYVQIFNIICKGSKGIFRLDHELLGIKMKSLYPSFDRLINELANKKGIDPKEFKDKTLRLRVANKQLHLEKLIDDPLI